MRYGLSICHSYFGISCFGCGFRFRWGRGRRCRWRQLCTGLRRRQQGYTAAMIVEESRMLQVSIFQMLQNNIATVDFSLLLAGVMAIADEVDSQLAQTMSSYVAESMVDRLPVVA